MNKSLLIILIFHLHAGRLSAQGENDHWIFGKGAYLSFQDGRVQSRSGLNTLNTYEGCTSVSDKNGRLLFYSDGVKVWNHEHKVMENGSGLMGDPSSTSSSVAVPFPGHPGLYYLFCVDANFGSKGFQVTLNLIDMNLNDGLGKIIRKNQQIFSPSDEKIAVTRHCNMRDFWIVMHKARSAEYRAYLLNENGLSAEPVPSIIPASRSQHTEIGFLKFSADGNWLANAQAHGHRLEIHRFDKKSGKISHYAVDSQDYRYETQAYYGLAFSANGRFLYASCLDDALLYQYDLLDNPDSVFSRRKLIMSSGARIGALQLARDGKMYASSGYNSLYLHCILYPDSAGAACRPVLKHLRLNRSAHLGLPTFVESADKYIHLGKDSLIDHYRHTLRVDIEHARYLWSTGDTTRSIEVYQSGTYSVLVYDRQRCLLIRDTISIRLLKFMHHMKQDSIPPLSVCAFDSLRFPLFECDSPGAEFRWTVSNTAIGLPQQGSGQLASFKTGYTDTLMKAMICVTPFIQNIAGKPLHFEVHIHPAPRVDSIPDRELCGGSLFRATPFRANPVRSEIFWFNSDTASGIPASGRDSIPACHLKVSERSHSSRIRVMARLGSCKSDTAQFQIVQKANPLIHPMNGVSICAGQAFEGLRFGVDSPAALIQWICTASGGYLPDSGSGPIPPFSTERRTEEKILPFQITAIEGECRGKPMEWKLHILPAPRAVFRMIPDSSLRTDGKVSYHFRNLSEGPLYSIWDFGDEQGAETRDADHLYNDGKSHRVVLWVEDQNACTDSSIQYTPDKNHEAVFIPTAFSPDGNKDNPVFYIGQRDDLQISFRIYNRWGELLYSTENNHPWDGTFRGVNCPEGVYLFAAEKNAINGSRQFYRGSLTLIR